jgi:hypothetical protein
MKADSQQITVIAANMAIKKTGFLVLNSFLDTVYKDE